MVDEIVVRNQIQGGERRSTFRVVDGRVEAVRRVDDFGPLRGSTVYGPEWVSDTDRGAAQKQATPPPAPRKKRAKR